MGIKPAGRVRHPLRPALRIIDWPSGTVVTERSWDTPTGEHPGPAVHAEFTSSWTDGDTLLQPTRVEVLRLTLPSLEVTDRLSHPLFTDLHSACPTPDGGTVVAATGHDSVLVFNADGSLRTHHWLPGNNFEAVHGTHSDFRIIPFDDLKPHREHPNHVFLQDDQVWVTCLRTQCCRCVTHPMPALPFPEGPPHDGRLREGLRWFTTINGHIIGVDPQTRTRRRHLDLNQLTTTRQRLGWCRGIDVRGDRLWVGMTTLRASLHREWLRWMLKGNAGRNLPTRIIEIDLAQERIVREVPVGNAAGGTLYAIHALP